MSEKLDGRRHGDNVQHVPAFAVCPPPRCCRQLGSEPDQVCGQPATHLERGNWWFEDRAYCRACAPAKAVLLPAELAVRRVRMRLDVYVAGTHGSAPLAQREALEHVRRALADAGAVTDLVEVRSTFGRYPAQPVARDADLIGERG